MESKMIRLILLWARNGPFGPRILLVQERHSQTLEHVVPMCPWHTCSQTTDSVVELWSILLPYLVSQENLVKWTATRKTKKRWIISPSCGLAVGSQELKTARAKKPMQHIGIGENHVRHGSVYGTVKGFSRVSLEALRYGWRFVFCVGGGGCKSELSKVIHHGFGWCLRT